MTLPRNLDIIETKSLNYVENGISFEILIRTNQALKHKSTMQQYCADAFQDIKYFDTVVELKNKNYRLIFNKFNLVQRHYLLVSIDFCHQKEILTQLSFEALAEAIQITNFYAFYNGGQKSGSSQPRQHFQLVELDKIPIENLIINDKLRYLDDLQCFVETFPVCDSMSLYKAYINLIKKCRIQLSEPIISDDIAHNYFDVSKLPTYHQIYTQEEDQSTLTQLTIDDYSLIIANGYMIMFKRSQDNFINSISLTGQIFVQDEQSAQLLMQTGILNTFRTCIPTE
ncbi:ATP adenylyltransferase [Spironucleus salmonicida]|uniref:ATP adenylyltransferase n=1 Tax=Spironucleus salmonicida TaxID=348837 RepID=V6LMV7_9EUKA|nr:ATP adenylyltransferase [Spironucleus salmonicida]|eukprot:EST45046.1 ATP adenylyltransferase [Spironucleus salmonicida]